MMRDDTKLGFGMHQGKEMANVPDGWLKWFWGKNKGIFEKRPSNMGEEQRQVMSYIKESFNEKDLT